MWCVPRWIVQSQDDGCFLASDGEGSVVAVRALSQADAFDDPASAVEALQDHFDGCGVVIEMYIPVASPTPTFARESFR